MPPLLKTALVIGAARGIGLAIASPVSRRDQGRRRGCGRRAGGGSLGPPRRPRQHAGITGRSFPIWELTDEDWQRVIDVDLTGDVT
jgi:NAD(P)-dependent dehydrogenase (short-subunit alcohol dehydrogenase family)